jgi:putative nucleotidyltransferase with HDIG domain/PAS domain S-box-containing protein
MITVHDTDFNIIRSNKAAEKILGLTCLEGSKSKCYENYHGMGFPASGCPGCQCLLTGEPNTSEMFEPHLNRFIEISAIPRRDNRNKLIGLIHIVRDITGRKRVEQQIAEQMQRLAALRNIDTAITSSLDMRISIKIILTEVANQLHVDACDILFLNPHTQDLEYIAGRGFNTEALRHTRLRLGESHAGVAALEKRTVRVRDLSVGRDGFVRSPLLGKEGFVEYIAVPLISKGHVKGVLEIFHRTAINADQEWLDFMEALGVQSAIAIDNAQMFNELEHSNTELALAYDTTLEGWSRALDYRDKETEGHSRRVTEMTVKMAQSIGIIDEDLVQVRRGALLHDIGKLGVPDGILLKPGKLTDEEMEIMKKHPIIAYEILSPISFLRKAIDIPYCHHEKWDGTGYPRGLKGEQIPLAARIFAVVDVFDALMSDRPYREAWTKDKTLEYIREQAGIHFDPTVVENFIDTDWLMVK